jgi:hypothetical protein
VTCPRSYFTGEYDANVQDLSVCLDLTLNVLNLNILGLDNLLAFDLWEWSEDLGDVTPPLLTEILVPLDGDRQTCLKRSLLVPAKVSKLGTVNRITSVVERTVVGVLDPLVKLFLGPVGNAEALKELRAHINVGDLVI